jgi:predicted nucleic acid-binding protein
MPDGATSFAHSADLFIAAHARSLELTLVTNSTDEFSRVAGGLGLNFFPSSRIRST